MNLSEFFFTRALNQPDHPALIGPNHNDYLTYSELKEKIIKTADFIKDLGIKENDTIALHFPSGKDYIVYTYAIWRCNASVVPISMELTTQEKELVYKEICITHVISNSETLSFIPQSKLLKKENIDNNAYLLSVIPSKTHPKEFLDINPAFLRFSSGTTGASKGIILSHETVYERINAANKVLRINSEDRIMWLLSMSYHFTVTIVAYLTFGATILLSKNHFAKTIIQTINNNKATIIYGSPVHYDLLAHDASNEQISSLRLAISTAAYLRNDIAEAFYERFKLPLNEAYGIIEIGLPCINYDAPISKKGSVGRILPDYDIFLKDIGLGEDLRLIHVNGKGILDAYYNPWKPRNEIMTDGWFSTGDLGYLDVDGYLFIQGRSKEIINTGGMKFFPQEIETLLEAHSKVKEACVYAHRDDRMGEIPHCDIVVSDPDITEAELKNYCAKHVSAYKVPEKFNFVSELVRTASGKLIRQESRIK